MNLSKKSVYILSVVLIFWYVLEEIETFVAKSIRFNGIGFLELFQFILETFTKFFFEGSKLVQSHATCGWLEGSLEHLISYIFMLSKEIVGREGKYILSLEVYLGSEKKSSRKFTHKMLETFSLESYFLVLDNLEVTFVEIDLLTQIEGFTAIKAQILQSTSSELKVEYSSAQNGVFKLSADSRYIFLVERESMGSAHGEIVYQSIDRFVEIH